MENPEAKVCTQCQLGNPSDRMMCVSCGAPLEWGASPVHLDLLYLEDRSRLLLLVKWLLAAPLHLALFFYGFFASIVYSLASLVALFTSHYPWGMFNFIVGFLQTQFRAQAYFPLLFTDDYNGSEVTYAVDYPERLSRKAVITRFFIYFVVDFLVLGAMLVLYLVAFLAWWVILLTGRYPRALFGFSRSVLQWIAQVSGWRWGLRDEWSLFGATRRVVLAVAVGCVVLGGLIGFGISVPVRAGPGAASEGEAVVASFMRAGKDSDVEGAVLLAAGPAESRDQIERQFNTNRHLFDGFSSVKRTESELSKEAGQPDTLTLEGDLNYESGPQGTFIATLLKLEGKWKIGSLDINREQ